MHKQAGLDTVNTCFIIQFARLNSSSGMQRMPSSCTLRVDDKGGVIVTGRRWRYCKADPSACMMPLDFRSVAFEYFVSVSEWVAHKSPGCACHRIAYVDVKQDSDGFAKGSMIVCFGEGA